MALFGRNKIRDGVQAEATVLTMAPTAKAARQTAKRDVDYAFALAVRAPDGIVAEVEHTCRVPHDKLPTVGLRIPVTVAAGDATQLRIDFDRMPSLADRALASAQAAQRGDTSGAAEALGYRLADPPRDDTREN
jgi:hypothetical protein